MNHGYGVLRADPDRWVREDNQPTPHLQIRVLDKTGQPWRVAVNVRSDTGSDVVYWLVDPLIDHPVLAGLSTLPTGFSAAAHPQDPALDYVRAPLFDWRAGTALPASGSASADDLQDLLTLHLQLCKYAGGASLSSVGWKPRARTALITACLSAVPLPVTCRLIMPTGTP